MAEVTSPPPNRPIDYATPQAQSSFWRRPWTLREKIIAAVVVIVGAFALYYVVLMCAMVASGLSGDPR